MNGNSSDENIIKQVAYPLDSAEENKMVGIRKYMKGKSRNLKKMHLYVVESNWE